MATESNKSTRPGDAKFKPTPVATPATGGYPQTGTKTAGIVTRGNGAATKGRTARGPMA
jgi:hypothetical protein